MHAANASSESSEYRKLGWKKLVQVSLSKHKYVASAELHYMDINYKNDRCYRKSIRKKKDTVNTNCKISQPSMRCSVIS
jgi:hypothetical protein